MATSSAPVTLPKLGPLGWARWAWRQLTSMRTALFLLLLLAIAALPGSWFPQRSLNATRTADYLGEHPRLGPWLDRFGFFEVYASPWFSAIYLLLLVSLIGCVLPRTKIHWRALRTPPPPVPARLTRLPVHTAIEVDADVPTALAAARAALGRRYRVVATSDSIAAETGYAKETGNLLFHFALITLIIGVALGHVFGWKGDVIVPVGETFANTALRYDTLSPGPRVDTSDLPPFTLTVDRLDATFEDSTAKGQFGQPRDFTAYVRTTAHPGAEPLSHVLAVNHPVEMDGATVFLLGNGYAPVVTVRDADEKVLYTGPTPFLARDNNYTSSGAIKVPGAAPKQLGFFGNFLPTATITPEDGPISVFPDARSPALALGLYEGVLSPGGTSGSVYTLNTKEMTQILAPDGKTPLRLWLEPGDRVELPGDRGSITFDRVERFAGLSIRHDPAKNFTLVSSLVALLSLIASLIVKRRRIFVRVAPAPLAGSGPLAGSAPGSGSGSISVSASGSASGTGSGAFRSVVEIAGLSKGEDEQLAQVIESLSDAVSARVKGSKE